MMRGTRGIKEEEMRKEDEKKGEDTKERREKRGRGTRGRRRTKEIDRYIPAKTIRYQVDQRQNYYGKNEIEQNQSVNLLTQGSFPTVLKKIININILKIHRSIFENTYSIRISQPETDEDSDDDESQHESPDEGEEQFRFRSLVALVTVK